MENLHGTYVKALTVTDGIKKGKIIKVLENTVVISCGVHRYLVKKENLNKINCTN